MAFLDAVPDELNPQVPDELLSTTPVAEQTPLLSLSTADAPALPRWTDPELELRANKFDFALGAKSPGVTQIKDMIATGQEDKYRQHLMEQQNLDIQGLRVNMVQQIMKNKQGPLTQPETDIVMGLSLPQMADPEGTAAVFMEKEFGRRYTNVFTHVGPQTDSTLHTPTIVEYGLQQSPAKVSEDMDIHSNYVARTQVVQDVLAKLMKKYGTEYGSMNPLLEPGKVNLWQYLSRAGQEAQDWIPFLSWLRVGNMLKDAPTPSWLPGSILEDKVRYLWRLPVEQQRQALEKATSELWAANPLDALRFAAAAVSLSADDVLLKDVFGVVEVASFIPIGTALKLMKGVKPGITLSPDVISAAQAIMERERGKQGILPADIVEKARGIVAREQAGGAEVVTRARVIMGMAEAEAGTALKDSAQAVASHGTDIVSVLSISGDIERASIVGAAKDLMRKLKGTTPADELRAVVSQLPDSLNPDAIFNVNGTTFTREARQRLTATAEANKEDIVKSLDLFNVQRATPEAYAQGFLAGKAVLQSRWGERMNDAVITYRPIFDPAQNVHHAEMVIGTPKATLFGSRDAAQTEAMWKYGLADNTFAVRQQGQGFYISLTTPTEEVSTAFRSALLTTKNRTPESITNAVLQGLRTPLETLAEFQVNNRALATHAPGKMLEVIYNAAKRMVLPKGSREDLRAFLVDARDKMAAEGRGVDYKTLSEFETAWTTKFNRAPTEAEASAYYTTLQIHEYDWMLRAGTAYREKSRLGLEQHSILMGGPVKEAATPVQGMPVRTRSGFFDGKAVAELPKGDAGVYFFDHQTGKGQYFRTGKADAETLAQIKTKISDEQYKVIQVFGAEWQPLKGTAGVDDIVNYVVARNFDIKPLAIEQLPKRPGGHIQYYYPTNVKQADIRTFGDRSVYYGDKTILNVGWEAQGTRFAELMNKGRVALAGKSPELANIVRQLPEELNTPDKFKKAFGPGKLNVDEPFHVVPAGKTVREIDGDWTRRHADRTQIGDPHDLLNQIDRRFIEERSDVRLHTVVGSGTEKDPFLRFEPARIIDPIPSIDRATSQAIQARFFNDYRYGAVETWVQEFGHLTQWTAADLRRNPFVVLNDARLIPAMDKNQALLAQNQLAHIKNLLNLKDPVTIEVQNMKAKLLNSVYDRLGIPVGDIFKESILPMIEDPSRFLRAAAFHPLMGLFSPHQLFIQAQAFLHTAAISPVNAFRSLPATFMMRAIRHVDDEARLAKTALAVERAGGMKQAEFRESLAAMRKTGWDVVEGEVASLDDQIAPQMFLSGGKKFLHAGTFFFREGERISRIAGWNTAYLDWKALHPTAVLDDAAAASILQRAKNMTVNMTREAQASWQQGWKTVPTQFWSFPLRLSEQMLGTRLTGAEKIRLFTMYSAMYGIPVAGGAITMMPAADAIREKFIEEGININGFLFKGVIDGFVSAAIQGLTGTDVNFNVRYGPSGVPNLFKEYQRGEKTLAEIMLGASGGILGDMMAGVYPAWRAATAIFSGKEGAFPMVMEDAIDVSKNFVGVNVALRSFVAWNYGRWLSKNDAYVADITKNQTLVYAAFGLTPRDITDMYATQSFLRGMKTSQDQIKPMITKEYRRMIEAQNQGYDELAAKHMARAQALLIGGDFRPDEMPGIFNQAIAGMGNRIDKTNMNPAIIMNANRRRALQERLENK